MAKRTASPAESAGAMAPTAPGASTGTPADRAAADLAALRPELERGQAAEHSRYGPKLVRVSHPTEGEQLIEVPVNPPDPERLAARRPDMLDFTDLAVLAKADPALAADAWQRVREAARRDLEAGHHAARRIEGSSPRPYDRAAFLELREALIAEWQPRGATERLLIDNLTQAFMMRNSWLWQSLDYQDPVSERPEPRPGEQPHERANREREEEHCRRMEAMLPPRITTVEATDRATTMVEQWDRMIIRTVRALRELRKQTVVIENHGQVNVAEIQQVNVQSG